MGTYDFFLIPFLMDASMASGAIVLNLFAQNLGATPFQLGMLGFSWGLPYSVGAFLSGRLADRLPRRLLLTFGLLLYSGVMFGYSFCGSVGQLIALGFLSGLGSSFFWPVFETLLHEEDLGGTNRRMGAFNMGWTLGITTGSASGGYLMALGPRTVFRVLGTLVLANLTYLLVRSSMGTRKVAETDTLPRDDPLPPLKERLKFLYVAWVANFVMFFSRAATTSMFPKVARVEGIPDGTIGLVLSLINVGQGLVFIVLSRTSSWHYRAAPIFVFEGVALAGMLLLGFGRNEPAYAAGMLLQGFGMGMAYSSSLFYALSATESKGASTGVHEMLVGSAFVSGPLLAGLVAQKVFLKAAFYLASSAIFLGSLVQLAVILLLREKLAEPEG